MKFNRIVAVLALSLSSVALYAKAPVTLPVDPKESVLTWTGHSEVGTYAPSGTLSVSSGQVMTEGGHFKGATLTIDMSSLTQSNAGLAHHLKSPDFFDVDKFPTSTLKLDTFDKSKSTVTGTLTIKGKTLPIQAPVAVSATGDHFTVTGKVTIDRTAYGIVYNSTNFFSGLGDKAIRNTFEVEFKIAGTGALNLQ